MDDLYREIILDHYKHPRNFDVLENPDASAEKDNPLCGDKIRIEVSFQKIEGSIDQKIKDIKFSGQGCAICIASTSMLTEKAKGMTIQGLRELSKDDIVELLGTELTPARIKCATLSLEVAHKALNSYKKN